MLLSARPQQFRSSSEPMETNTTAVNSVASKASLNDANGSEEGKEERPKERLYGTCMYECTYM